MEHRPLPRGKQPLTRHGLKDATTETATIKTWWTLNPTANIGVATGAASGIVVLDLDEGGEESLKSFPPLPYTWVANTARGMHFYFSHTGREVRNSAAKLGPGLDVRGDGGYVVAAPSVHPDGSEYEWTGKDRKLQPWPDFLVPPQNEPLRATLRPAENRPKATGLGNPYATAALERELVAVRSAPVGTRNDQLNRSVFAIWRFVLTGDLDGAAVVREFSYAARSGGLEGREIAATIASASRQAP